MDLWQELPFSDTSSLSSLPPWPGPEEQQETTTQSNNTLEPKSSISVNLSLDHYTYRDYQQLPCDYVIRPSDMLLYSSLDSHSDYQGFVETMPMNYPPISRPMMRLTEDPDDEEEHVKMAKRIGLIQHLPTGTYDGCRKNRECVICMMEFTLGDSVRYLPCMHTYHVECINSWLMRSFTCPSCMEPVDAALLTSYETN